MHSQFYVFCISFSGGVLLGILFDFFRAVRKKYQFGTIAVGVQDLIFCFLSAIITFLLTYFSNNGEIRLYIFAAVLLGAIVYNATISNAVIRIILFLAKYIGIFFKFIFTILLFPMHLLYKILKKPLIFICIPIKNTRKFFKEKINRFIINLKKTKKRLKLY